MKKNIVGLQKFTDFEQLKTVEDFTELLENDKEKFSELVIWLQDGLNEAINKKIPVSGEIEKYFNRIERVLPLAYPEENKDDENKSLINLKRDRWYINDNIIKNYIHKRLSEDSHLPTNTDICRATGLSRVTIDKHIKENGTSIYKSEEGDKYKMLNDRAINRLYQVGMTQNNLKALKLFIDYTKEPTQSNKVVNNNYLQINNTRIDNLLLEQIPINDRLQIEQIIINSLPKNHSTPLTI